MGGGGLGYEGGDWGMENGKLVKGMRTFFFIDWMANFKWQFFFKFHSRKKNKCH